jgi:SlyX protein
VSEDERFIDLEVKLAYQERLIRDLDQLVREFASRLEKAEQRLAALPAPEIVSDRPPHY